LRVAVDHSVIDVRPLSAPLRRTSTATTGNDA
jgi:hypothetical protein